MLDPGLLLACQVHWLQLSGLRPWFSTALIITYALRPGYGNFSRQCWAMSLRLVTQTTPAGFESMYSTNFLSAPKRPGLPMILQCRPTVIILGVPA